MFLTADQNVEYQQNLAAFDIGVVVLAAYTNRLADLIPLIPRAEAACREVAPGEVRIVRNGERGRAT